MINENRERQFRLRPRRPRRAPGDEGKVWSLAFKRIMHIVRMSSRRKTSPAGGGAKRPSRPFIQRCAVRMTYSPNRTRGQWAAHGRYLARESAMHSDSNNIRAFGPSGPVSDIQLTLGSWQKAGDPRLFKLIISPEFGERADLERLTRELIAKMEQDLGTRFEWVATAHFNTEHPHVHVALRGITPDKKAVFFPRPYVQHSIRHHAEELTTAQLGPRTLSDTREAQRREVEQMRYTSLDQTLQRSHATATSTGNSVRDESSFTVDLRKASPTAQLHHLKARLLFLEKLDLVETTGSNRWRVRSDFETVLRAIGQTNDRQRALAAHRALLSDPRVPFCITDATKLPQPLEGRVIGHGEDESNGRVYMLLEGTDYHVHFIYHSREIEQARHRGQLKPNSFVRLRRQSIAGKTFLGIFDYGDADKLLTNSSYVENKAKILVEREIVPTENGWAGWLGRYETALAKNFQKLERQKMKPGPTR